MKKLIILLLIASFSVFSQNNSQNLLSQAKTSVTISNSETVKLKLDFWKNKMPTTDKKVKDNLQFAISISSEKGLANINPIWIYFISSKDKTFNDAECITYKYKKGNWTPVNSKLYLTKLPDKVVVEFSDKKDQKIYHLKNEGPFTVEVVH